MTEIILQPSGIMSVVSSPTPRLTHLPSDCLSHISRYLRPQETDKLRETCTKICDAICQINLDLSRSHPIIREFTPEIKKPSRLQSWQIQSRLTRLVVIALDVNKYWRKTFLSAGWRLPDFHPLGENVHRPYRWALKNFRAVQYEELLMVASLFSDSILPSVPINYDWMPVAFIDFLLVHHLLLDPHTVDSRDPQIVETVVQEKLFDLMRRSSFYCSDGSYGNICLHYIRNQLISLALLVAANHDLKGTYSKLLQLEAPSTPKVKKLLLVDGGPLLRSLCINKITPHYIRELFGSQIEISSHDLHTSLIEAANYNNIEALREIFRAKPGTHLDRTVLEEIRDSFQPQLNELVLDFDLRIRRANFPDESSINAMIHLFNDEIEKRFPNVRHEQFVEWPSGERIDQSVPGEVLFEEAPRQEIPRQELVYHELPNGEQIDQSIPRAVLFEEAPEPEPSQVVLSLGGELNSFQEEQPEMVPDEEARSSRCRRCTIS